MKDVQVLHELYKEQRDLSIHHENQRATMSNLMLTADTILIGLIALDNSLNRKDLAVALAVVFLGIFGALFTLKHYERFRFHRHRSRLLRKAIDAALRWSELHSNDDRGIREEIRRTLELDPDKSAHLLGSLVEMANDSYKNQGHFLAETDLHKFWAAPHLVIAAIGLVIVILTFA